MHNSVLTYIALYMYIPWLVLSRLSSFPITETFVCVHLNRTFICPNDILKAICCLTQVLPGPFQPLHFIHIPYKLAIRTATTSPAKLCAAPNYSAL